MRRMNYSVDFSPDWLMSGHAWFMMDGMLAANVRDLSFLSFLFCPQVTHISVIVFVFLPFEMKFCMLQRCVDKQSRHLLAWPRGLEGNVSVPMVSHSSVIVLVQQKFTLWQTWTFLHWRCNIFILPGLITNAVQQLAVLSSVYQSNINMHWASSSLYTNHNHGKTQLVPINKQTKFSYYCSLHLHFWSEGECNGM